MVNTIACCYKHSQIDIRSKMLCNAVTDVKSLTLIHTVTDISITVTTITIFIFIIDAHSDVVRFHNLLSLLFTKCPQKR